MQKSGTFQEKEMWRAFFEKNLYTQNEEI